MEELSKKVSIVFVFFFLAGKLGGKVFGVEEVVSLVVVDVFSSWGFYW